MASKAVRFIAASKKSSLGSLQLHLRVRPGASRERQGIKSVTEDVIDLCVAAQPRDGDANRAVVSLLSDVLQIPRSRLQLIHGLKSRDKIVNLDVVDDDGKKYAQTVLECLQKASDF